MIVPTVRAASSLGVWCSAELDVYHRQILGEEGLLHELRPASFGQSLVQEEYLNLLAHHHHTKSPQCVALALACVAERRPDLACTLSSQRSLLTSA